MNVLSLFDGMSCGRLALERANIEVTNYYTSEIDKFAIKISEKNHSDIIRLGDVTNWRNWDIPKPDLILAGSPCQGFSVAGYRAGFDDPRSNLFWHFVDILEYYQPKYFLLENVKMKSEWKQIITDAVKVEPILINSALVSAQMRKRLYWANFPITQPEDKGILLQNIIEDGFTHLTKSYAIDANYFKGGSLREFLEKRGKGLNQSTRRLMVFNYSLSGRGNGVVEGRITSADKALTLTAHGYSKFQLSAGTDFKNWRILTPLECERLQTLPDNYTEGVSNTQRYKMLGNGWTVDVIVHILKDMVNYERLQNNMSSMWRR